MALNGALDTLNPCSRSYDWYCFELALPMALMPCVCLFPLRHIVAGVEILQLIFLFPCLGTMLLGWQLRELLLDQVVVMWLFLYVCYMALAHPPSTWELFALLDTSVST